MKILKKMLVAALVFAAASPSFAQKSKTTKDKNGKPNTTTATKGDKLSQALGIAIAQNLESSGFNLSEISPEDFAKGMASYIDKKPLMSSDSSQKIVNDKFMAIQAMKKAEEEKTSSGKAQAGKDFLLANGKRANVKTTASGLQYEIIKEGNGAKPTLSDKVKVHYHGTLIDGKVFDSSVDRGEPISFQLSGVIQGWQEGVALMSVGAKYKLFIPENLAYGSRPAGSIPPFSALIFEVELLGINVD
jgi:FKBP-type peptidyl-prolyl cis-trans isomerase FklB